ncbi:MAG: phage tail tape measure protein, partial [Cellvibrionaceae bacterium]|nr:phage tail tape measure protein [Cellvibrionaceae bacterium]
AMGLTQEGALDLANATNYLSNNMNAKAKQIAGVVVRQGSTAMQAGFSSNESAALAAGLIAGGATEETASTAMKNITGALTSGYAATGSQTEAMERLGFNPEELASSMQEDAKGTLIEVLESLQNVEAKDRGAIISELFGTEVKGAVAKLVKTLDDNKNGLKAAFARVAKDSDRANSVNNEYENVASTRGHQLNRLKSKFEKMAVTLGDRLLPAVDVIVPHLISAVDWVTDIATESPKLTSAFLGVAAGIAAIKAGWLAFKVAKLTMGNLTDRGRLFKTKLSGTTDQTALSAQRATRALDRLNRKLNQL